MGGARVSEWNWGWTWGTYRFADNCVVLCLASTSLRKALSCLSLDLARLEVIITTEINRRWPQDPLAAGKRALRR